MRYLPKRGIYVTAMIPKPRDALAISDCLLCQQWHRSAQLAETCTKEVILSNKSKFFKGVLSVDSFLFGGPEFICPLELVLLKDIGAAMELSDLPNDVVFNLSNFTPHCHPRSSDRHCRIIFHSIVTMQLVVIVVGIILNMIIVTSFVTRRALRKRIQSILLFNQALSDLFNAVFYGISTVSLLISDMVHVPLFSTDIASVSGIITIYSSLFLYTVIAFERFLAIQLPLWHRVNLRKRYMWIAVAVTWCFSMALAVLILLAFHFPSILDALIVIELDIVLQTVFLAIVIFLFILTFIKTLHSMKSQPTESASTTTSTYFKKQLRITGIFFLMFMSFAVVFIPLTVDLYVRNSNYVQINILNTMLMLTSVINPLLTLYYKKIFRASHRCRQQNIKVNNIEMLLMKT